MYFAVLNCNRIHEGTGLIKNMQENRSEGGKKKKKKKKQTEGEKESDQIRLSCGSSPISEGGGGSSLWLLIGCRGLSINK